MSTFVLDVDYDEPDVTTYRGVLLRRSGDVVASFSTGEPGPDFLAAFIAATALRNRGDTVLSSSSIGHFHQDGAAQLPSRAVVAEACRLAAECVSRIEGAS